MNTARSHVVPVHAKAIYYNVNGTGHILSMNLDHNSFTGRDSYISYNNGGITKNSRVPAFSMSGTNLRNYVQPLK